MQFSLLCEVGMLAGNFAAFWVAIMVLAIAANAAEPTPPSRPEPSSKTGRHEKTPTTDSRQEGMDKDDLADACGFDRPSKENRNKHKDGKKEKPDSKWDGKGGKCGMIAMDTDPKIACTLGGTGRSNGWYFDSKSSSCKDTRDMGSCSPRGPFESESTCKEAVDKGTCSPSK
jgi:hypothetical protein